MDAYSGKYYLQGGDEQDCTALIMKDKISIGLRDESGNPRVVYWPFHEIIRDSFWKRGQSVVRCGSFPVQTIEIDGIKICWEHEITCNHLAQKEIKEMIKELIAKTGENTKLGRVERFELGK